MPIERNWFPSWVLLALTILLLPFFPTFLAAGNNPAACEDPPALPDEDLRNNLLENGHFKDLAGWVENHGTQVSDRIQLTPGKNFVAFERIDGSDGGHFGVEREVSIDCSDYRSLFLRVNVWVGYHTLGNSGWWGEQHGTDGELPVHLKIYFQDAEGKSREWSHGFLGKQAEAAQKGMTLQALNLVPLKEWVQFKFDLLDPAIMTGPRGEKMPRPMKITKVFVFGNGWSFKGAVGNLMIWGE